MSINKTTLKNQLIGIMMSNEKGNEVRFAPITIDGVEVDKLLMDNNEECVGSVDNTWVFPLNELTINEMKEIKRAIKNFNVFNVVL